MKQIKNTEIETFNYRAFLVLANNKKKIKAKYNKLFDFTPSVLASIYIENACKNRPLNINRKIKNGILKVYCDEIANNANLKKEFDKLSKEYRMFEGKDYMAEVLSLEFQIVDEVQKELKRIGKTFTRDCKHPIEFMTLDSTSKIIRIYPDGNVKYGIVDEIINIRNLINKGNILLYDAAILVGNLRKIPTPE